LSRDPIEEIDFQMVQRQKRHSKSFETIYGFVKNMPISKVDNLGLATCCKCDTYKMAAPGFQMNGNISIGGVTCTYHGRTASNSNVVISCSQTYIGKLAGYNCAPLACKFRAHYVCSWRRPKAPKKFKPLPYKLMWVYLYSEKLNDCQ
jgi:hypothetical protein